MELAELEKHFKKASTKQKIIVENEKGVRQEKTVEAMNKEQFRSQMGLLGQQQHPFLADRIFEVFDREGTGRIVFKTFADIMDVLCNGTDDEKT